MEHLSQATAVRERLRTYQAVREARLIPPEASDFLIAHAIQWLPGLVEPATDDMEAEHVDEEKTQQAMDEKMLALLQECGGEELAKLFTGNRLEYDRRHERGRQFFMARPKKNLLSSSEQEASSAEPNLEPHRRRRSEADRAEQTVSPTETTARNQPRQGRRAAGRSESGHGW